MQTRCALVGMPGSGKSTVGRQLARRLGLPFIDLDQRLEQQLGTSIRSYFELHGEQAFRDHEAALLAELAGEPGAMVLSTGGGAVLRPENREALRRGFAHVLYLRASPEEIFRRIRHDRTRPLLQVADPLGRLRELYQVRDPLYRETAHYVIETGRPTVNTLVNMAMMQLEMAR
ncbi:shikimate kinase [Alicycliphilus sp. T452]|jgi:shikimate kinase